MDTSNKMRDSLEYKAMDIKEKAESIK